MGIKSAGFFQLFDWNKKSSKKLFADGTVSPELKKDKANRHGDKNPLHLSMRLQSASYGGEPGPSSSKGCSSMDEELQGIRAPGVVARLMGLNSLPMTTASDPRPTTSCQSQKRVSDIDIGSKLSNPRKPSPVKSLKVPGSPIERFSNEILPARSVNPRRIGAPPKTIGSSRPQLVSTASRSCSEQEESCSARASSETSSAGTRYHRENPQRRDGSLASGRRTSVPRETPPIKKKTISSNGRTPSKSSSPRETVPKPGKAKISPKAPPKSRLMNRKKRPANVAMEDSRSNRTDIVSFSFTSPMGKPTGDENPSKVNTSHGLKALLEMKLRELSEELETEVGSASCSSPTWEFFPEKETVPLLVGQCSIPEPSPVSILEAPFPSESSSSTSEIHDGSCRLESPPISPWQERDYIRRLARWADVDVLAGRPLDPRLFDQLEEGAPAEGKTQRKVLFDCAAEWFDTWRQRQLEQPGWTRGNGAACMAEEVCQRLAWWRGMGDWMLDELVAADMGFGPGRWLNFDTEKFEAASEMECSLFADLVSELVADFRSR
ncbi:uncharacterized protein LOC144706556 isoform X2 [Wolffia australiana]